jgi:hypothetical protein
VVLAAGCLSLDATLANALAAETGEREAKAEESFFLCVLNLNTCPNDLVPNQA